MANDIKQYYDYNMPKGVDFIIPARWTDSAYTAVTIQPATAKADFVEYIELLASDDISFAGGSMKISNMGYGGTTDVTITDLAGLIAIGDPTLYKLVITGTAPGATVTYHSIVLKPKPPRYLRSSTTPAESLALTLATIVTLTAGTLDIVVHGWECDEVDSGLE